ncbi:MAG: T9SS type A sorting domain-containing protein [Salinivirgaceae bacterium]|jgi:hypothetical protein|nr:T9SS type A sorting domain-containing protein [Salinivirgaceae bacterium]
MKKNRIFLLGILVTIISSINAQTFSQVSDCTGHYKMDASYGFQTLNTPLDTNIIGNLGSDTLGIFIPEAIKIVFTFNGNLNKFTADSLKIYNDTLITAGAIIFDTANAANFGPIIVECNSNKAAFLFVDKDNNSNDTKSSRFDITWQAYFEADGVANDISCKDSADGSAQVYPIGGTAPYIYQWSGGSTATTRKITGISSEAHDTVLVTDTLGCIFDTAFHIIEPDKMITTVFDSSNVVCKGEKTGWIDLNVINGTSPYSYLWSTGQTTKKADTLLIGSYNCTITDVNNCLDSIKFISIDEPTDTISIDTINIKDTVCIGGNNGGIKIAGIGGTPALVGTEDYKYLWNTGSTIDTIGLLSAGNYFFTVTDSVGCTYSDKIAIDTYLPISITENITHVTTYGDSDGEIDITVSDVFGDTAYNWTGYNVVPTDPDQISLPAGSYNVTVTDDHDCTATESFIVNQPAAGSGGEIYVNYTGTKTDTVCEGLFPSIIQSQTQAFDGIGVTYEWQYSTNLVSWPPTGTLNDPACDWNYAITENTYIRRKATKASQTAYSNNVLLKFIPKYSKSINNLALNYCEDADTVVILGNPNMVISTFEAASYLSNITGNQATFTPSTAGSPHDVKYIYEDSYGCADSITQSVNVWPVPNARATNISDSNGVSITCKDSSDGFIVVEGINGTGAYTYKWGSAAGNSISDSVYNLSAGSYLCTVTDSKACKVVWDTLLTEPAVAFNAVFKDSSDYNSWGISCNSGTDGWIEVEGMGGIGIASDFEFAWNDISSQITATATGLDAGTYSCIIKDKNKCPSTISSLVLSEPSALALNYADSSNYNLYAISCNGEDNAYIEVIASNGVGSYNYLWSTNTDIGSGAQTSATAISLPPSTNYKVTVTDVNGCMDSIISGLHITEPSLLTVGIAPIQTYSGYGVSCESGINNNNGEIIATGIGGTGSLGYQWDGSLQGFRAVNNDTIGLDAGTYLVRVKDVNGCIAEASYDVTPPPALSISITDSSDYSGFGVSCANGKGTSNDGYITSLGSGGAGSLIYQWDGSLYGYGANNNDTIGLTSGAYLVRVKDANGCLDSISHTITQPNAIIINTDLITDVTINGTKTGVIDVSVSNNSGIVSDYDWTGTGTVDGSSYQNKLGAGSYTLTVTDANSCQDDESFIVNEPTILNAGSIEINGTTTDYICDGETIFIFDENTAASGGITPNNYTFSWEYSTLSGSWTSITTSETDSTYTWNKGSSLTEDLYIRRIVDNGETTATSNTILLDYIPTLTLSITNLDNEYCKNGDTIQLIGSPTNANGTFSGSGIVLLSNNNGTALFSPKIDTIGDPNPIDITYTYTDNGCTNFITEQTTIRPVPDPSFDIPVTVSSSKEEEFITNIITSGGSFYGPGVISNQQKILVEYLRQDTAEVILHEVQNSYGCRDTLTKFITKIKEGTIVDNSNILGNPNLYFCYDGGEIVFKAQFADPLIQGRFLPVSGVVDDINKLTGRVDPSLMSGIYDLEFLYETSTLPEDTIKTQFEVFNISSQAKILDLESKYCKNNELTQEIVIHALETSEGSGVFSGPSALTDHISGDSATIDVNAMTFTNGTPHTISYLYTHAISSCTYTRQKDVNIYNQPNVNFTIKDTFNVKGGIQPFGNLDPSSGGTFTGTGGVVGQSFNPQGLALGNYTITYSYTDTVTGCANAAQKTVNVDTARGEFLGINNIYCVDAFADTIVYKPMGNSHTPVEYKFYTPIDTVVVSTLTDTIVIVPDTLTAGAHTIEYSYLNIDGITKFTLTKKFYIDDIGTPSIDVPKLDYCNYDSEVTLYGTINDKIAGRGEFTGVGLILDLTNDGQATFVPQSANFGPTAIEYSYKSTFPNSSCYVYDTVTLTVHDIPVLGFDLPSIYDIEGINDTLQATPSGGDYSPAGYFVADNVFDPSLAGVGTWPITYGYTDVYGCSNTISNSANIEQATGSISNLKNYYCYDDDTVTLTYTGLTNPSGAIGKFTGKGIIDLMNNTALFIPHVAYDTASKAIEDSLATVTLTFEYFGSDNKTIFSKTQITKVRNNGKITINNLNDSTGYCENVDPVTLSATPARGVFTGSGISGNIFTPKNVNDTATIITYTYTDAESGCSIAKSENVTILNIPTLSFTVPNQVCSNSIVDTLVGYPRGGEITTQLSIAQLGGFTDSVKFTPSPDFIGSRNITYTYTNPENNCTNYITNTIKTDTIPDVTIDFTMPTKGFCNVNVAIPIEGVVNGLNALHGIFTAHGIIDSTLNTGKGNYNPLIAGPGDDPIIFTYTDDFGCTNTAVFEAIVHPLPNASINGGTLKDTALCGNNSDPIRIYNTIASGNIYTIDNQTFYSEPNFIPSNYGNQNSVVIKIVNEDDNGCSNTVSDTIEILKVPDVSIDMSTICIAEPIQFLYEGDITTEELDSVTWDFGDGNRAYELNTTHQYKQAVPLEVKFYLRTKNGCAAQSMLPNVNLENNPNAEFSWKHECISDPAVEFTSTHSQDTYLHVWSFGDGDASEEPSPKKTYTKEDKYIISHRVQSGNSSCFSIEFDTIFIRPTITINPNDDYIETFEGGHGFWIPEMLDTISNFYTWQHGQPAGTIINRVPNNEGMNIYATNLSGKYNILENSAITSPCFIFENMDRPMISLDIFQNFDPKNDGVVLEYNKNASDTWVRLGEKDEGINWYNSENIRIEPGNNSNIGWTEQNNDWQDSRHVLDDLINDEGKSIDTIRFRIAFRSDDYEPEGEILEGFAFDNIKIGERKRMVLIEHFTNTEISGTKNNADNINAIINNLAKDAIDIQYHTSLNSADVFYNDYPIGASSREAYYGIEDVPYTYYDGIIKFGYELGGIVPENENLKSQALTDPSFKMSLDNAKTSTSMNIKVTAKATEDIINRQLQLFVAIVEKAVTLSSDELVYENVLRRFLPNPGGTYINTNWTIGESETYEFDYTINDYVVDKDTLIVVAFIQDEITKEVLQVVTNDASAQPTSIEPWLKAHQDLDFIIYPNPANERAYFAFGKNTEPNSSIQIINQNGKIIDLIKIPTNTTTSFYEFSNLQEGLYYVRWINNDQQKIKKLIIAH